MCCEAPRDGLELLGNELTSFGNGMVGACEPQGDQTRTFWAPGGARDTGTGLRGDAGKVLAPATNDTADMRERHVKPVLESVSRKMIVTR
mmetsp:Transcript_120480/g.351921  ORF Transcript_120480/g.351921 Transcript_120480/m.351921 type:complete len:90 (-) Transcript_120480:71-340(-)